MDERKDPPLEPKAPASGTSAPPAQQNVAEDPGHKGCQYQTGEISGEGDRHDTDEMKRIAD